MDNYKFYLIEQGEMLDFMNDYRKRYMADVQKITKYVKSLGGENWGEFFGTLSGVVFPHGKVSSDFCKPNKYGVSEPKKRSVFTEEFKEYTIPLFYNEFSKKTGFHNTLSYKTKGGMNGGSTSIEKPQPLWFSADGAVGIAMPDYRKKRKEVEDAGKYTISGKMQGWEFDTTGLKEILKEEWDLIAAKYRQEQTND